MMDVVTYSWKVLVKLFFDKPQQTTALNNLVRCQNIGKNIYRSHVQVSFDIYKSFFITNKNYIY